MLLTTNYMPDTVRLFVSIDYCKIRKIILYAVHGYH